MMVIPNDKIYVNCFSLSTHQFQFLHHIIELVLPKIYFVQFMLNQSHHIVSWNKRVINKITIVPQVTTVQ